MDNNHCKNHTDIATKLAVIEAMLLDIKVKICSHIQEGEEKGGYRDRLIELEWTSKCIKSEVSALKNAEWKRVIIAGLIGGMVSRSPEFFNFFIRIIGL